MPLTPEDQIVRNDAVLGADVNEEVVLLDVESGRYFGMAETARAIWEALAAPITIADLCARLSEDYDAPAEQIGTETIAFLDHLEARGLVRRV